MKHSGGTKQRGARRPRRYEFLVSEVRELASTRSPLIALFPGRQEGARKAKAPYHAAFAPLCLVSPVPLEPATRALDHVAGSLQLRG